MEYPKLYPTIGLMSGTSCDGLDVVAVTFQEAAPSGWDYHIHAAETRPFPTALGEKLANSHLASAFDLTVLDAEFGCWMGEQVSDFCQRNQFKPLAVASHGHTVFHQPEKKITLQIGNGWSMHVAAGMPVINDFRSLDVQLGGQGAPLVPIGDKLLFSAYDFCLNLGGIANISFDLNGKRIAFDVSPFNLLFNHFSNQLGHPFDRDGMLAKAGRVHDGLLLSLNELAYYQIQDAKSLGREHIERDFLPLLTAAGLSEHDLLATLSAHFAEQIIRVIRRQTQRKATLLVSGGGAYNSFFIEQLREKSKDFLEITIPSPQLVEFKEALIFAFLGVLRLTKQPNCLSSVTGASSDNCGGTVYGFIA